MIKKGINLQKKKFKYGHKVVLYCVHLVYSIHKSKATFRQCSNIGDERFLPDSNDLHTIQHFQRICIAEYIRNVENRQDLFNEQMNAALPWGRAHGMKGTRCKAPHKVLQHV